MWPVKTLHFSTWLSQLNSLFSFVHSSVSHSLSLYSAIISVAPIFVYSHLGIPGPQKIPRPRSSCPHTQSQPQWTAYLGIPIPHPPQQTVLEGKQWLLGMQLVCICILIKCISVVFDFQTLFRNELYIKAGFSYKRKCNLHTNSLFSRTRKKIFFISRILCVDLPN